MQTLTSGSPLTCALGIEAGRGRPAESRASWSPLRLERASDDAARRTISLRLRSKWVRFVHSHLNAGREGRSIVRQAPRTTTSRATVGQNVHRNSLAVWLLIRRRKRFFTECRLTTSLIRDRRSARL